MGDGNKIVICSDDTIPVTRLHKRQYIYIYLYIYIFYMQNSSELGSGAEIMCHVQKSLGADQASGITEFDV